MFCKYCSSARAYLVCGVSITRDAVATGKNSVYFPLMHNCTSHVIAYESTVHAGIHKFIHSQTSALQQGASLIAVNAQTHPAFFGKQDRTKAGTVQRSSERTRVAVCKDALTAADKRKPVFRNSAAHINIFTLDRLCFRLH